MTWNGTKKYMEAETMDGYLLTVKPITISKYTWTVYYNGTRINHLKNSPIYKDNMPKAKRQAIRLMVSHMLQKLN